jgi:sulfur relay (sulfurtransferase) complex TusBCD TusD component (DsrE family)
MLPYYKEGNLPGKKGEVMSKSIILFLNTSPYNYENTYTCMKIAEAALEKRLETRLVASTDGIYGFLKGQVGSGMPNAGDGFKSLMSKGLKVSL